MKLRWHSCAAILCYLASLASSVEVQAVPSVWTGSVDLSWNNGGNWSPVGVPNAPGAEVQFDATGSATVVPITNDGGAAGQTVGSITYNATTGTTRGYVLNAGTSGSNLKYNNNGSPVTITTSGTGTGNFEIAYISNLTDSLIANVNQTTASSSAGSLNLTGTMNGAGGITKNGDGLMTFGSNAKNYTGATVLNGGRTRISNAAHPKMTSSFTINSGGQLTLISAGTYKFGNGDLNLNGSGAISGPFAVFPGAIRNDTNLAVQIDNPTVLQSATLIHVQGAASGLVTLTGAISGPGQLALTAPSSDNNLGKLVLTNAANIYTGGTLVRGGTFEVGSGSSLGTGNVTVEAATFAGAVAKLQLDSGVTNAIADSAILSLAGGSTAGAADNGFIDIAAGINDTVGGLILGGVTKTTPGTYGSVASGAMFQDDEYFSGPGVITLAPAVVNDADFDNDGKVDGNDFVIWQRNLNSGTTNAQGDTNNSGSVDGTDLTNWKGLYGTPAVAAVSAVPEPTAALLLALGLAATTGLRRKR